GGLEAADDPTRADDTPSYDHGIPVILQTRDVTWDGSGIAGFTARSRIGDILAGHATAQGIEALSADPNVIRIDFSRDAGEEELDVSIPAVRADVVHGAPTDELGANAIVGIIDAGLDVLHEAFRDANGNTRIIALWDQSDNTGPAPQDANGNPLYGTLHTRSDIDGMINSGTTPMGLGRDTRSGHGTHVTSIAAGRAAGGFSGGMAPESGIIFVKPKLETPAGDPLSIGYSLAHVDALSFIDRVARNEGNGLPVAVNISLGMNAGAHDGTSTLEAAFDNFTASGRMPGRVLVKSAGNAASQGLHAHFQTGSEQVINLAWQTRPVRRSSDIIEVWFNSSDDLTFRLIGPGSAGTTTPVGRNADIRLNGSFANGNTFSMVLDRFHRDNGDTQLTIMITRGTAASIEPGIWTLRVESGQVLSAGHVDAWIERRGGTPASFVTQVAQDGTLSIPGTAHSVICVAALDRQMQGQVMSFSSRGSTRDGRRRPDIGAPGNDIVAARAGTSSGTVAMPGTSMAAPHVTGAIALLLSQQQASGHGHQLNANQVRAALSQSARGFNGHWNSSRGWGMLDAEALLGLFR
ncbi:MAG: S8 family serine peptidase, partial [Xanthomonadales bacterium]|nr:S8 family serine peptidase [Xanthomonadales bacterium]NIX13408.1 S8 family serine peptidase [Xanthomonadales bacterium]